MPEEKYEFEHSYALDELDALIETQKQRLAGDRALEENMPKTMPSLDKEVGLLGDLLEKRARLIRRRPSPNQDWYRTIRSDNPSEVLSSSNAGFEEA